MEEVTSPNAVKRLNDWLAGHENHPNVFHRIGYAWAWSLFNIAVGVWIGWNWFGR